MAHTHSAGKNRGVLEAELNTACGGVEVQTALVGGGWVSAPAAGRPADEAQGVAMVQNHVQLVNVAELT